MITDKNVLGFDIYKVLTYRDADIRRAVALNQTKSTTEAEAICDSNKSKLYYKFMDELKMCGTYDDFGNYTKGIEDYVPNSQYRTKEHREKVIEDILENWMTLSRGRKFSAIFATSSIPEAIEYYKVFKEKKRDGMHQLNVTALFDPNIDNDDGFVMKEEALLELIDDYNELYDQSFIISNFGKMKKDISLRLAHKKPYNRIQQNEQIDLLIVVVSSIPLFGLFSLDWIQVMRLTRIFKSLRLFELIPNYKKLLINFRLVIRSCIGILVGLSILIFLLSIILSSLYGSIVPEYFGNPLESIYSVFRLFSIEGWYDIPNAIAERSSYVMGYLSKFFLSGIVLVFGIFGMGFVSSMFIDEVTSDNNDEVLQRLSKLEEILKKIQENGTT